MCCLCVGAAKMMKPISSIDLIRGSRISQEDFIKEEIKKNQAITLILRIVTFVIMVLGIYLFFSPIVEILGYIPIVGGFLKGTVGAVIFLGALIVSIPLYLLTFTLAWLRYHPKIGLMLLAVTGIIIIAIVVLEQQFGGNKN